MDAVRVSALHALTYCERLYYLQHVEDISTPNEEVHAGRSLHEAGRDRNREWQSLELASESWGIHGKVDFARYRDGNLVAIEHKKGRAKGDAAWDTDILQVTAYAVLLEECFGKSVPEGRVRYHATNKTVRVAVDDAARRRLRAAVARARELSRSLQRPPVTDNENLCAKCSLAPVCLPEESRLAAALNVVVDAADVRAPRRLFPKNDARRTLHVVDRDALVKRSGLQLVVRTASGEDRKYPGMDVGRSSCTVVRRSRPRRFISPPPTILPSTGSAAAAPMSAASLRLPACSAGCVSTKCRATIKMRTQRQSR